MNALHDLAYFSQCVGTADYVVNSKSSKPTDDDWQIGLGDDPIERDGWPAWIRQARNTLRLFRTATKAAKNAVDNANEINPEASPVNQWKPRCYRLLLRLANAMHDTGSIDGDVAAFVDRGRLPSEWPTWITELAELADEYEAVELAGVNAPEPAKPAEPEGEKPNAVKVLREFVAAIGAAERKASDEEERDEKPTATEGEKLEGNGDDDDDGYVMAVTIWKGRFTKYEDFRKWLENHPNIPTKQKGQRRLVHAAKCLVVLDKENHAAFDRLDDTERPEVVPDTVDDETYLGNVESLYRDVFASKKPQK